jgi:hypothetical protein
MFARPWVLRTSIAVSASTLAALIAAGCSSDSDNNTPAAGVDSGAADVAVKKEAAPPKEVDSASMCEPGELPGFVTPAWTPPAPFHSSACSPTQVEALVDCIDPQDQATCDTLMGDPANQDCQDCLFTDQTSKALGPLILSDSYIILNTSGCIANVEGDTSATSCGAKYDAALICEDEACGPNCPGDDQAAFDAYLACVDKAATGVCEPYATPAKCADTLLKGAAAECAGGDDFIQAGKVLGKLFCTNGATDGGKDGAADAPKDAPADG